MQCPYCHDEMRFGRAAVKGTFWGFLIYGMSYKNLYFTPRPDTEADPLIDELILNSGEDCNAWNCGACEITLLDRKGRAAIPKQRGIGNWWEKYH